jgi:hypothetical protein
MAFEWEGRTHGARMERRELRDRSEIKTPEDLAGEYEAQAERALAGADAMTVRYEVSLYAKDISTTSGMEQDKALARLVKALNGRKIKIFETIPDEQEQIAFARALVEKYQKSLQ